MPTYPDPEHNPKCQCWPNLMAAMFCPYGHMLECHYPQTCSEAECSHYERELDNELGDLEPDAGDIYGGQDPDPDDLLDTIPRVNLADGTDSDLDLEDDCE